MNLPYRKPSERNTEITLGNLSIKYYKINIEFLP
jgi:hypothetical protein